YRHFALPLQDFSALERALGQKLEGVEEARRTYLRRLSTAKNRAEFQAALAAFAVESGVLEALEGFSLNSLNPEAATRPLADFVFEAKPSILASGFPAEIRNELPLPERLQNFIERWPENARLVSDVPFTFGKGSQQREVLVLAREGLTEANAEMFRRDYVDTIGCDTISFPLREGAEHLRTRIGALTFALSPEGLRVDDYQAPRPRRRRLEAVLRLESAEMWNLRRAVGAILDNTLAVLGPITLDAGSRRTTARIDDNRPLDGGEHNCTTWITLAPLGTAGEDLATLAQMPAHWTSHDNPGWWSMFLTGASRSPRAGLVVYWTDKSLHEEPCASGVPIPWDFNLR
ncbi:unnamed protein product, partial [Phaeothamnion confervicola]